MQEILKRKTKNFNFFKNHKKLIEKKRITFKIIFIIHLNNEEQKVYFREYIT